MEKIRHFFASFDFILFLLILFISRILYFGASFADAPIAGILVFAICFKQFMETKKEVISENKFRIKVNEDIGKMQSQINSLSLQAKGNPFNRGVK